MGIIAVVRIGRTIGIDLHRPHPEQRFRAILKDIVRIVEAMWHPAIGRRTGRCAGFEYECRCNGKEEEPVHFFFNSIP